MTPASPIEYQETTNILNQLNSALVMTDRQAVKFNARHERTYYSRSEVRNGEKLRYLLSEIARNDTNYEVREPLVWKALVAAQEAGYQAGVRMDPEDPEWPVVFIELPQGQVSWHMLQHGRKWDGHSTDEKYRRVSRFVSGAI